MNRIAFFEKTGKMAIGSRLRMLTDRITNDAERIYRLYGVELKPKWFPVFFVLSEGAAKTITGIAREIGHSHPSVSHIVKEMAAKGIVRESPDATDRRRNRIELSDKGKRMAERMNRPCADVAEAVEELCKATRNDLWRAIGEWEELLAEKSLLQRVEAVKRAKDVRIVPYEQKYQPVFRALNERWITAHWQLEAHDREILDDPQAQVLDKGGFIFVALDEAVPVGVCALLRMNDATYDYELAKLAVDPRAQGKGIGGLLCRAAIDKARTLGASKLFLESNTRLEPAIHLYRRMGFTELAEYHPAYERGDIQMELTVN